MSDQKTKLKVIRILDPILCVRCDHAYIADVVMSNGRRKKMFYCSRLDCDNWLSAKEVSQAEVEI
ncbi:MAG: hypothetical protein Q7T82_05610 [Armatimonadota bacterium]|nr:hypothetical protein [Armatimonadota bacterium]